MSKIKQMLFILPVIAVIVLCSFLPGIALKLTDSYKLNIPSTAPLRSVELTLEKGSEHFLQRLVEFNSNISLGAFSTETTAITKEDALQAIKEHLQTYMDAGLIPPLDSASFDVEPVFWIASDNMITWNAMIKYENINDGYLIVHLDDSSGKLLSLQRSFYPGTGIDRIPADPAQTADTLSHIFFGQLGISPEQLLSCITSIQPYQHTNGDFSFEYYLQYSKDTQITVQFSISAYGFRINRE